MILGPVKSKEIMPSSVTAPGTCERCKAPLGLSGGVVCSGCRERLCARHFTPRGGSLCDACRNPLKRRRSRLRDWIRPRIE